VWLRDADERRSALERYRPRVEGLFARIEKITLDGEAGFYWKVTTRDNVVTMFGRSVPCTDQSALRTDQFVRSADLSVSHTDKSIEITD